MCVYLNTFSDIEIEEVAVEHRLDTASNDGDQVEEALRVVAVDPVENVQRPVAAECKQVVTGDRFCLACLTDHEQLWQDRHRLQVDRECPQDLRHNKDLHFRKFFNSSVADYMTIYQPVLLREASK